MEGGYITSSYSLAQTPGLETQKASLLYDLPVEAAGFHLPLPLAQ